MGRKQRELVSDGNVTLTLTLTLTLKKRRVGLRTGNALTHSRRRSVLFHTRHDGILHGVVLDAIVAINAGRSVTRATQVLDGGQDEVRLHYRQESPRPSVADAAAKEAGLSEGERRWVH